MSHYGWIRPTVWILQIPLLWLLASRFKELVEKNATVKTSIKYLTSQLVVAISYLAIIASLVIVLTGHSDFIANI